MWNPAENRITVSEIVPCQNRDTSFRKKEHCLWGGAREIVLVIGQIKNHLTHFGSISKFFSVYEKYYKNITNKIIQNIPSE